jgi:LDH2 family malate/lactate/ureidoglycolate dehydrogenase
MESTQNIRHEAIKTFVAELFTKGRMKEEDAVWFAETIVHANLRGIDSHGILRVPDYFARILCGAINPRPDLKLTHLAPAVTLVDADDAAGCVSAKKAMECALKNAEKYGVGIAGVKNSNHFGAAAEYAQIAVNRGMVGIAMTNVPPLIGVPGVRTKLVGNNPVAIGIPTYSEYPFMLDMSMSVVAEGKLRFAAAKGAKIPTFWAADANGNPTDDPEVALKGFLLPMGSFKGLGLAYVVDVLSGVITSGIFADKIRSMYRNPTEPGKTGHMMIAINLSAFLTPDEMKARMKYYHEYLEAVPLAEGALPLCFPGEVEHNCELERLRNGIPVPDATMERLEALRGKYNVLAKLR